MRLHSYKSDIVDIIEFNLYINIISKYGIVTKQNDVRAKIYKRIGIQHNQAMKSLLIGAVGEQIYGTQT